jgi:hypothetical protein
MKINLQKIRMFAKLQKEPDLNYAIQKLVQDECNILLNQIPIDNIITHLWGNRSEEIFIPQYYTTEHIIQRVKSRLDKDITQQQATDILKDLSNHDGLFNSISEDIDNVIDDKCDEIIEEKEEDLKQIITYWDDAETIKKEVKEVFYINKKGEKQGFYKVYVHGKVRSECTYKDDQLHGECKEFGKDGNLTNTTIYKDGIKQ